MSSSDQLPGAYPAREGVGNLPPGDPTTMKSMIIDKGAAMIQSMKPIKQMSLHLCSFACYSHDPSRQIEVNFYVHRVNEDFLQCAVYDCESSMPHLIGLSLYFFLQHFFIKQDNFKAKCMRHAYHSYSFIDYIFTCSKFIYSIHNRLNLYV